MEQHLEIHSVKSGCEESTHNIGHFVCAESQEDLWSSQSSLPLKSCVEVGSFANDLLSFSPESNFQSFQNSTCSNNQISLHDFTHVSSYDELQTPMKTSIPFENRRSAFVAWKSNRFPLPFLQLKKSQNLHKCCISFLNCIKSHKSSSLSTINGRNPGVIVNHKIGGKHAIRHAAAERRRRDEMKNIFFALRSLLPAYSQKSKATVLVQIVDYVNHLKRRVEVLEKRNEELEQSLLNHTITFD